MVRRGTLPHHRTSALQRRHLRDMPSEMQWWHQGRQQVVVGFLLVNEPGNGKSLHFFDRKPVWKSTIKAGFSSQVLAAGKPRGLVHQP